VLGQVFPTMRAHTTGYLYRALIQEYRGNSILFRTRMMRAIGRPFMRKCRPNMRGETEFVDQICVNR
jgi:hypothetical protein